MYSMDLQTEKSIAGPEVNEATAAIKAVYDEFLNGKDKARREHRAAVDVVLKDIDERQIEELKEKLRAL